MCGGGENAVYRGSGRTGVSAQPHVLVIHRKVVDAAVGARVEVLMFTKCRHSPHGNQHATTLEAMTRFIAACA